ncbi:senescence-associated protein SPA15, chloroplastic isoform X1 [Salvia miltiorrhiza]|uniref:senescence-associated protein SPA15, chloroplastic isoform X1 n=1 Tax=Salvia miltiorrhiza TaxID=226208 RepID=UPI0025ABFE49|nr:senescence-associated protein SPA15, chloroplastic isoform X1 [Salvia miltiorrhiza]XP_057784078.1 senescence-associated protein SPA15, chloroplastic isoform X1 [Salvia miltiorrhiza]XP_057784079.1 senescence-associated protein SPA15, chloroplastic isoform X1 [Salvia miltiorrhiza]XP_057784080.1 senescence-associated protein SPA15, chloroplastic isoform X1 [Salvia miltiorrhiza]
MAKVNGVVYSSAKSPQHPKYITNQGANHHRQGTGHLSLSNLKISSKRFWPLGRKLNVYIESRGFSLVCQSTETQNTETKERVRHYRDGSVISRSQSGDEHPIETGKTNSSSQGLAEACKFVSNDAKFMNERARNDIVLLSRGIMKLDARARQDVAFLGSEFLKLDARAREDTEKIDLDVKKRAERLHHVATILKNIAESRLKRAADKHWSDGALEADLKRANFAAKRRVMEDSLMALEFLKNIHDMMVSKMQRSKRDPTGATEARRHVTLEKNGKTLEFLPGDVSTDRIDAIQEAYESMAAALSVADGIDYTDPEELELLVAALIDLDAMDGKSSVSLLAECSSSPDVSTRRALANALSTAPSMWTLGNAGMGALQRLAEDSNPAIAAAAAKTIYELKRQWEIEEGDSWRFMMNQNAQVDNEDADDTETD